ncbi:MAG: AMP-binding protein [Planctomycetes bacterium]|jgi:acyl-CoA synthetase (AMP-forming)/AMP-acid ligase II|nr:AMP-binding protein [Planctomycetota bacterium]
MNIADALVRQAEQRGGATAIIQPTPRGDRAITFAELDRRSAALAARLRQKRLEPGQRVLVLIGISIDLYVAITALFRAGMTAMFLDPSAGREHVRRCCQACPPDALMGPWKAHLLRVIHPGLLGVRCVVYPRRWERHGSPSADDGLCLASCGEDHPALLTFTSGSTATPKAAIRTHGLLAAQQAALAEAIDLQPGQIDLATLPVFVLANLAAGVTTLLADADLRRPGSIDAEAVLRQIDRHVPTRSAGSPAFYHRLAECCEREGRNLGPLRQIYTGGAPVFPDLLERLARLMPAGGPVTVYGSTEAEPIAHLAYTEVNAADRAATRQGAGLPVGNPVRQVSLRIVDPGGLAVGQMSADAFERARCAADVVGEILVSGDHVLQGYVNPADDSETKLRVGEVVWHRTGDMGRLDAGGRLWLLGRVSAVIRDGRGVVYPFAVECAARQLDGVCHAAVVAVDGRRVLAVELRASTDQRAAVGALHSSFADDVDEVVVLPRIPLDARHNAKVHYPELRRVLSERLTRGPVHPGDQRAD